MHAYGYLEDKGGKGGNNVASLLIKGLHDLGWIHEGTTGKHLSIILDNCGGQNKNNYVLRLALWLVERSYFHNVDIIFYIRGHTKNACDRLFNQLKKGIPPTTDIYNGSASGRVEFLSQCSFPRGSGT